MDQGTEVGRGRYLRLNFKACPTRILTEVMFLPAQPCRRVRLLLVINAGYRAAYACNKAEDAGSRGVLACCKRREVGRMPNSYALTSLCMMLDQNVKPNDHRH